MNTEKRVMFSDSREKVFSLYEQVSEAEVMFSDKELQAVYDVLEVLQKNRVNFRVEPWHVIESSSSGVPIHISELLFHGETENKEKINFLEADSVFRQLGCGPQLDELIISIALQKASFSSIGPVSLNVGIDSLISPYFWKNILPKLEQFGSQDIVLEILEHNVPSAVWFSGIEEAKAKGIRFALDDFQPCKRDWERLDVFGAYLDFVKLDGAYLFSAGKYPDSLQKVIHDIKTYTPQAALVAEWVPDAHAAKSLRDVYNITLFQGMKLPPSGQSIESQPKPFSFAI